MARTGGRLAWLIAITAAAVPATAMAQLPTGYTIQSFGDEFDGTALDTTKWNAGVINYPSGSTWLWRNHPGNNAVSGGYLVQTTLYQDVTGDGVPEWTCSSVAARSFSQRFGYWESRIRITDFDYTDNAWWSSDIGTGHLSGMDGFEIDAPEAWSPNKYTASIYDHGVQDGSTPTSIHFAQNLIGKNFTTTFSVFGWDWGIDNSVKCYVDGTLVHTFPAAAMNGIEALVPQGPIQGTALWTTGLTPSNTIANGDSKYVDYVRVYQKPGWIGTGGLKNWNDAANWGPDGVPASGRAAVFNTAAASGTITIAADQPVQELVFQGGATGTTTIAGSGRLLLGMTTAVTATTGAIGGINLVNDTTASVTVAADMVAQRKVQFSNFAGASITTGPTPGVELVLAGDLAATTAGTPVNFLTTAPIVVTGSIDGSIGRITKGGQGIVRLNAANAFAGGLEIRDGIIEVNADGALGAVAGGVTMEPGSVYDKPSLVLNGVAYSDPVPIAIRGTGSRSTGFPQSSGAIDSTGTSRLTGPITAVDDATISVQRGGQLTLSGTLDTRDHVVTLGSIGTLAVTGRITGSSAGQIDKYNTGSTSLTGDNSGFLGSVKVRLGTLVVNGDAALGGGSGDVVRLEGGTLQVTTDFTSGKGGSFAATSGNAIHTNGRSIAFNGSFSGPGGVIKQGAGTLTFGGSNSFQGATRIQSGTLAVAHAAALAGATLDLATGDAGTLRLAIAGTTTYLIGGLQGGRDLPLGGNTLSIGHNGTNTTYSGRITGTGGIVKAGSGVLTLSGSNGFVGPTTIAGGVLSISTTAALPGWNVSGRYGVADGATLAVSNTVSEAAILTMVQTGNFATRAAIGFDTSAGPRTYAADLGGIRGTFGLTKVGGNTLIITGSNSYTGPTVVTGGTLQIGTGATVGSIASGVIDLAEGGAVAFNRSDDVAYPGVIGGAGNLLKQGAGTLVLSGSNGFTGITRVVSGTLAVAHVAALAGSTLDLDIADAGGVRLAVAGPTTYVIGGLQGGRRLDLGANSISLGGNDHDTIYAGEISGSGGLVKTGSGTLSLSGSSSFTGTTRLVGGTLSLEHPAALAGSTLQFDTADAGLLGLDAGPATTYLFGGLAGDRSIAASGNTLSVGGNGESTTYAGVISGTGGLEKSGGGTTVLTADHLFSGRTAVLAGLLRIGAGGTTGSLASSTIDLAAGAVIAFDRVDALRLDATLSGPGSLEKRGAGTLTLAAATTFSGTARITAGRLSLANTAALANATLDVAPGDAGSIGFDAGTAATYSLGGLQGTRDLAAGGASLSIGANGESTAYAGVLSGSGGLVKVGGGTLTLTGTSTFTGGTTIREGAVAIAGDSRLGAAAGGLTLDGGTLQSTAGMTLAAARRVTVGPGGGTLQNSAAGNLFVSGSVVGAGATLTVRTSSAVIGAAFLDGPVSLGRLALSGSTSGVGLRSAAVVGSAVVAAAGQTLHLNGLNSTGTATASYTGFDVTLDGGTLRNRFGGNTFSGEILLTASSTLENRTGNGNSLTLAPGTLTLGTNTLTVRAGAAASEWIAIAGGVSGSAASGLTVAGGGQLRLSGSNPGFAGRVTIVQGELRIDSSTAVDDRTIIGFSGTSSARTLTLNGADVSIGGLELTGRERVEIAAGSVRVAAGLARSRLLDSLAQGRGDGSWQSPTGITSSAVTAAVAGGAPRAIGWLEGGDGSTTLAPSAPGDTNIDGIVDVLDVANVMAGGAFDTGLPATWLQGDFSYDGLVDLLDLADFLSSGLFDSGPYATAAAPSGGVAAVPEPVFPSALAVIVAVCAVRRKRTRR
jgi:autotransporter-associated beta strand protein